MPEIRSSAELRNRYNEISTFCHDYAEPVFITKNGKGDLAVMSIEAYEQREQMLKLRERVLQAEQERVDGMPTLSIAQAREKLRERINEM